MQAAKGAITIARVLECIANVRVRTQLRVRVCTENHDVRLETRGLRQRGLDRIHVFNRRGVGRGPIKQIRRSTSRSKPGVLSRPFAGAEKLGCPSTVLLDHVLLRQQASRVKLKIDRRVSVFALTVINEVLKGIFFGGIVAGIDLVSGLHRRTAQRASLYIVTPEVATVILDVLVRRLLHGNNRGRLLSDEVGMILNPREGVVGKVLVNVESTLNV